MEQSPICVENCKRLDALVQKVAEETGTNDEAHRSFERRLDELEETGKKQNGILITLQKQADAIESMNGKIDDMADSVKGIAGRISEIEKEPAEKWKKISFEIVKYVVLAVAGAAIGYLMK